MPNVPLIGQVLQEDLPLYPPLVQLLRVTAATVAGPSGVTQTAGSSVLGPTLYVSFTQQLRTDGLLPRDREPCLVDDINGLGLKPGYYTGRLAGSYTSLPVYEVGAAGIAGQDDIGPYVYVLDSQGTGSVTPDADNRYQATLAVKNADGTLSPGTRAIWAMECNNSGRLLSPFYYHAHLTGFANGRDVYQIDDTDLIVLNESASQIITQVLGLYLIPDRCWTISAHPDGARLARAKRILEAKETGGTLFTDVFQFIFDTANAWTVTEAAGVVTVVRELNIREGTTLRTSNTYQVDFDPTDFDVTATASDWATIQTEGFTGSFDVVTNCVAGVLKVKCLTFTRGLLKTVGAERDLGSGSCP